MSTTREVSRAEQEASPVTWDHVKIGCLQRIADATEAMAKGHVALTADRDWYKRMYESGKQEREHLWRRICALRGALTKAKRKAKP